MTATLRAPPAAAEHLPDTPYVGLVPYTEADAAFFFGRAEEQHIVAGNLRASRLTILYGPSGVGKTRSSRPASCTTSAPACAPRPTRPRSGRRSRSA